jgi:four helix bundle protein
MAVKHYKELGVYGLAVEVRRAVFQLSKTWPKEERYALTDQVRRSSRSIGANVAEAWAKRRYERHFVSKLTDALAEAEETVVWLDVALECGYLDKERHAALTKRCRQICGGLVKMMREPGSWCGPAGLVREGPADYVPE